jgi:hypothetical protein
MPRTQIRDNPVDPKDFQAMATDGPHFRVADRHAVGTVGEGAVVPAKAFGPGAEIDRLLRLGAIREATGEEVEAFHRRGPSGDPLIDRFNPYLATGSTAPAPPPEELSPTVARPAGVPGFEAGVAHAEAGKDAASKPAPAAPAKK